MRKFKKKTTTHTLMTHWQMAVAWIASFSESKSCVLSTSLGMLFLARYPRWHLYFEGLLGLLSMSFRSLKLEVANQNWSENTVMRCLIIRQGLKALKACAMVAMTPKFHRKKHIFHKSCADTPTLPVLTISVWNKKNVYQACMLLNMLQNYDPLPKITGNFPEIAITIQPSLSTQNNFTIPKCAECVDYLPTWKVKLWPHEQWEMAGLVNIIPIPFSSWDWLIWHLGLAHFFHFFPGAIRSIGCHSLWGADFLPIKLVFFETAGFW